MFGRKYRFRSAESVIQELARAKHTHIFFYDDHFAANRSRTKRLVELMMQNGITAKWTAQVRADIAKDEEIVQLMAKANCEQLCIGFESLDAETLKRYNKKQTPEDVRRCISVLHKYGIKVHGMFISEGYSDVYNKLGLDSLQLSILIPLIGSKLYSTVKNARQFVVRRFPSDWQLFDGSHVVHWPENISPVEMQRQTMQALSRFYSRHNAIMLFLKGRWRDSSIRFMGYRIIRKWEAQNRSYIGRLSQAQASMKVPSRDS